MQTPESTPVKLTSMKQLNYSIHYAGFVLPIYRGKDEVNYTPLKPISDALGLKWQEQRKKVTESAFLVRRLGISGMDIPTSNHENTADLAHSGTVNSTSNAKNPTYALELFIRVDRVAAYLMTINPDRVRAVGNLSGADMLERKIEEWDNALHDYEELGFAVKRQEQHTLDDLDALMKMRRIAMPNEKAAFTNMISAKLTAMRQPVLADPQQSLPGV